MIKFKYISIDENKMSENVNALKNQINPTDARDASVLEAFNHGIYDCLNKLAGIVISDDFQKNEETMEGVFDFFMLHKELIREQLEAGSNEMILLLMQMMSMVNVEDKELLFSRHSAVLQKMRPVLLVFLNSMSTALSRGIATQHTLPRIYSTAESEPPFCLHYLPHFFRAYGELAQNRKNGYELQVESTLAYYHALQPFRDIPPTSEEGRVMSETSSDKGKNFIGRNTLALQAGNVEVISDFVNEFLYTDRVPGYCDGVHDDIKSLYPNLSNLPSDTIYSGERMYLSSLLDEPIDKTWLSINQYSREDIEHAKRMLLTPPITEIATQICEHYSLPAEETIYEWKRGDFVNSLQEHLVTIRELERLQRGSVVELYAVPRTIRCFGRYDVNMLLEQLKPLESGQPFGVMCTAYEDSTGAFMGRRNLHIHIKKETERNGMKLRIMEYPINIKVHWLGENLSMIAPSQHMDVQHQADFIWINEHGSTHHNNQERIKKIRKEWEDVFGIGSDRSSLVIKPGGVVASFMCYGGEPNNAMDAIASHYPVSTIGATKAPDHIDKIVMNRDETGALTIEVEYLFSGDEKEGTTATYPPLNESTT